MLGRGGPSLICSSPVTAMSSGPVSQAVEVLRVTVGTTKGDMIAGGNSSLREPTA